MHKGRHFYIKHTVTAAVLLMLAIASSASAATPAAISQYVAQQPTAPVAGGQAGGGDQQEIAGQNQGGQSGSAGTEAVSGSEGSLPFTGYPMTTIVWVMLGLVAAGVLLRLSVLAFRRQAPLPAR